MMRLTDLLGSYAMIVRLGSRSCLLLVLCAALGLASCGRKNDMELAPDVRDTPQAQGQPETLPAGSSPPTVKDRPFVLDGLL